jgi:hypothetical protein
VTKWKTITKISLQVLQNNYKHTGYDNNYMINLAISLIIHTACGHLCNGWEGKYLLFLCIFPKMNFWHMKLDCSWNINKYVADRNSSLFHQISMITHSPVTLSAMKEHLHSTSPFSYISFETDNIFIWNYKMNVCCKTSLIQFFQHEGSAFLT